MSEKKQKILLADDDRFISQAYQEGLTRAGFEVIPVSNGEDAMKKVKEDAPDLILLDLVMPSKDGFEVLTELQEDEVLKKIPVLILSNLGQDSAVEKGKKMGALDYLIKSNWSMKQVVEKINESLAG
jgi:DNA-binding response OmpR family regulator